MKAVANTEVYRPWRGTLRSARLRWLPLARANIKTAGKRKLPLVILLLPVAIATVIFAFVVYTRFALEAGETPSALGVQRGASGALASTMMAGAAQQMIQTREMIVAFHLATNVFSLLLMAWFGAGLIAEDRRLGAHLLYFARPLTKLDYLMAKLTTVMFYGALGALAPGLVICLVATFASPEWSFLTQQGDVIVATVAFGALWTLIVSSIVLCVSSLASRRTFALIGVFAWFLITGALAGILAKAQGNEDFRVLSPFMAGARIAASMFDLHRNAPDWSLSLSWISVCAMVAIAWLLSWWRVRRLEVVA
jgi:hypothetical protein